MLQTQFYMQLIFRAILFLLDTHPNTWDSAYFEPKKYILQVKFDIFHTFILINFLVQTPESAETLTLEFRIQDKSK